MNNWEDLTTAAVLEVAKWGTLLMIAATISVGSGAYRARTCTDTCGDAGVAVVSGGCDPECVCREVAP